MAVEGIGNLVQNLASQLFGQSQDTPAAAPPAPVAPVVAPVAEDTFTPSSQNGSAQTAAQEAGIFQVPAGILPPVTANIVIGQANSSANQNGAPAPAVAGAGSNSGGPQTASAANPSATANPTQHAAGTQSSAAASVDVQSKIQALNAALPALGLTNEQIQQIDRIASLVQDFNPGAYVNLVNQFEALAQQHASQQSAATSGLSTNSAAVTGTTNAAGGGFQVQGISINFTAQTAGSSTVGTNTGSQSAPANSGQPNPAVLHFVQAQFLLSNSRGQNVELLVPQPASGGAIPPPQAGAKAA
jgi:hypothetical protein